MMEIMLEEVVGALEKNNFQAHVAHNNDEVLDLIVDIVERENPKTIALGSSQSLKTVGAYNLLKNSPGIHCIDTVEIIKGLMENPKDAALVKQIHMAMTSEMFLCGTNAIISNGQLVNIDMAGNRVAFLAFGPPRVIVVAGKNKIVPDFKSAVARIKLGAAPMNAKRLKVDTPCVQTGKCSNCNSPQRICCNWLITEKCLPKNRITVILVDENLGF